MSAGSVAALLAAGWAILATWGITAATLPHVHALIEVFASLPRLVRPVATIAFAAHWAGMAAAAAVTLVAILAASGLGRALARFASRGGAPMLHEAGGDLAGGTLAAYALAGLAVAATAGLALGLAGLLFPSVTATASLVLAAAGLLAGPRLPRLARPRGSAAVLAAAVAAVFAAWALFTVPPQTWVDTLGYHYGAPAVWGNLHRVAQVPDVPFRYPLLFEHLVSLSRVLVDPAALDLGILALTALLLGAWTAGRFGATTGWLAAAGWLASSQTGFLASHVKHDLLAAAFVLLAIFAWDRGRPRWICGAALGWALSTKYTSIAPGFAILAWAVLAPGRRPARLASLGAWGLAAAAPFLLKCWLFTGNPAFPLLLPGLGWGEAQRQGLALVGCPGRDLDFADPGSLPRTLLRLGTEMVPLALFGMPFLLLGGGRSRPGAGRPLAAVAAGLLCWTFLLPCLRFMVPVFPLLAMLGAGGLATLARGGPIRRRAAGLLGGIALVCGAVQGLSMADFSRDSLAAALGLEPGPRYLARTLSTLEDAANVAASLPGPGRILLLGDSRSAPFNRIRTTIPQDVLDDPLPWTFARESPDAAGIAKRFRELGVTCVILNHVTSEYRGGITQQVFPWPPSALARYREFWGRWARPIPGMQGGNDPENGGFAFYRLSRTPDREVSAMSFLPGTEGLGLDLPDEGTAGTIRRLTLVLQFAPGVAQLQSRLWTALLRAREWRAAESVIRNGMSLGFRGDDVWASLGAALEGQGRFRDAAYAFRQAALLNPARPEYAERLAACEAGPARKPPPP